MMQRFGITKTLVLVIILSLLSACSLPPTKQKQTINDYLSITLTTITDEANQFEMNNYCYDLENNTMDQIASFDYASQYPLSYYDKVENMVYFTHESQKGNDEIYQYNCKSKKIKQMTDRLFAVNAMYKVNEDELMLVAVEQDSALLQIYTLNTKSKSLDKVDITGIGIDDFVVYEQYYNPDNHSFIFAGYDEDVEYEKRDQYNNDIIDNCLVDFSIYQYSLDTKELTQITSIETDEMLSLIGNNEYIYYQTVSLNDGKKRVFEYNIQTHQTKEIKELSKIYRLVALKDQNIFYIENVNQGQSSLKKIDLKTMRYEELFTHDIEGQMNNGALGYH